MDSNHRPRAYQARALTTWAMSPCKFRCISSLLSPLFLASFLSCNGYRSYPIAWAWSISALLPRSLPVRASGPGGDDGNRTHDPLLAGQVLSQLSYTPIFSLGLLSFPFGHSKLNNSQSRTRKRVYLLSRRLFRICLLTNTISQSLRVLRSCSP